jgi:hypothetical protein
VAKPFEHEVVSSAELDDLLTALNLMSIDDWELAGPVQVEREKGRTTFFATVRREL